MSRLTPAQQRLIDARLAKLEDVEDYLDAIVRRDRASQAPVLTEPERAEMMRIAGLVMDLGQQIEERIEQPGLGPVATCNCASFGHSVHKPTNMHCPQAEERA
jgi:hypothetical protein